MKGRKPVDKTAALVTGKGESYDLIIKQSSIVCSKRPLPTYKIPKFCVDLAGVKIGNMTVIGYSHPKRTGTGKRAGKGSLWVVKCVCGNYEYRNSRVIKKHLKGEVNRPLDNMCVVCKKLKHMREFVHAETGA